MWVDQVEEFFEIRFSHGGRLTGLVRKNSL
jgi:hypothetical protein